MTPGVFNTTIGESGFYLKLEETDKVMAAADIFGMFRFIWNKGIDILKEMEVLDRYGRTTRPPEESISFIREKTGASSVEDALLSIISDDELPEWTLLYPKAMLQLPIRQLAERFTKCNGKYFRLCYLKLGDWDMDVFIPIRSLSPELKDIYINRIVGKNFNLEIRMENALGNNVRLVVESNTIRMDGFLSEVSDNEQYIIAMSLDIARSKRGHQKNKLLCSIIIEEEDVQ